jgi:DNA-binding MarR family transcriptional regulator
MNIEEAIKNRQAMPAKQKAIVNLIYTYNWYMDHFSAVIKPFGITSQQYNVLRILRGRHPEACPVGEVKAVMLDKNPDLTRLCDRLLQKNLIERSFNPACRREVLLKITDTGLQLLKDIEPVFERESSGISLTDEELLLLSDLLDKIRFSE